MRLLIALAFLALASALPEPKPIELPAAALPTVAEQNTQGQTSVAAETTSVKVVDVPATGQAAPEAVKIKAPTLVIAKPTPAKVVPAPIVADEIASKKVESVMVVDVPTDIASEKVATPPESVKVVDASIDMDQTFRKPASTPEQVSEPISSLRVQELPHYDPEAIRKMHPDSMTLVDIGTLIVPEEVMRQVAEMIEQDTNAVNVGGNHPFSFNNAEPLDGSERVNVVDSPISQFSSRMDPVVVVESPSEETLFAVLPKDPEIVKVIDMNQNIPVDMMRPVPREMWRGPPPPVPRVQPQMAQESRDPSVLLRPRPVYYRDMGIPNHNLPHRAYNDPMLR